MINAKVVRIPGTVREVALNDGATVHDALAAADTSVAAGESVKLNGIETTLDAVVPNGASLVIAKGAKGNA